MGVKMMTTKHLLEIRKEGKLSTNRTHGCQHDDHYGTFLVRREGKLAPDDRTCGCTFFGSISVPTWAMDWGSPLRSNDTRKALTT